MENQLKIEVKGISKNEVDKLFEEIKKYRSEEFLKRFFECAFQDENSLGRIALSSDERLYYLALVNDRREALFGINAKSPAFVLNISSFGKLNEQNKAKGWQYLRAIINSMVLKGIKIINATVNDAGENAFQELISKGGLPINWEVELCKRGLLKGVRLFDRAFNHS